MTLEIKKRNALERYRSLMRAIRPGEPAIGVERALQLAIEFTELIYISYEIAHQGTWLSRWRWIMRVRTWRLRTHARVFAFVAHYHLLPEDGVALIAPMPADRAIEALACTSALLIHHRRSGENVDKIRWCVETASAIEKTMKGVPAHVKGLLEFSRAYLAWIDTPLSLALVIGCVDHDDVKTHLEHAGVFFDRALAPLGGSLSKLPTFVDRCERNLIARLALLAFEIAKLREKVGQPAGNWAVAPQALRAATIG